MRSAFALRIFSGKNIYNFAILENLRIFQNCLFTGRVVTVNGICNAAAGVAGRLGMRAAFALRIFSGRIIYNFAILENLRIFQNCLFTGGA